MPSANATPLLSQNLKQFLQCNISMYKSNIRSLYCLIVTVVLITDLTHASRNRTSTDHNPMDYCRVLEASCRPTCSLNKTISRTALCPNNLICCRNRWTLQAPTPTKKTFNFLEYLRELGQKYKPKFPSVDPSENSPVSVISNNTESVRNKLNTPSHSTNFATCGRPVHTRVKRVVGGEQVGRCVYPWMVYISRDPGRDDLCGGTLVSDRHVITAAHCFDFLESKWPTLTIGEYIKGEQRTLAKFVTSNYTFVSHPKYDSFTYSHDIAVLTLTEAIDLDKFECLNPICLPQPGHKVSTGVSCRVAGWGSTSKTADPAVSTPLLMSTSVQVVNGSYCEDKFGSLYSSNIHICAGDLAGGRDSCLGDSGGPFMCGYDAVSSQNNVSTNSKSSSPLFLMGVISAGGAPCAQRDTPALYTDVGKVMDWIQAEMLAEK